MSGKSFAAGMGVGTIFGSAIGLCVAAYAYTQAKLETLEDREASKQNSEVDKEIERIRKEVKADQERFNELKNN